MEYKFTFTVGTDHIDVIAANLHEAAAKCREQYGEDISLSCVNPND